MFAFDHSHSAFETELKRHVKGDRVDYSSWKKNRTGLDLYLRTLSELTPTEFERFTDSEKLAFWINAYNAFTVRLILDREPVRSIRDIERFGGGPWKLEFFSVFGVTRNLDWIEHEILRKEFSEPRIHFAINCASLSCPPLSKEAYKAARLEAQLTRAAERFLSDPARNRYDSSRKILYLSKIFHWFRSDFVREFPDLRTFYNVHSGLAPVPSAAEIHFLNYDWGLNRVGDSKNLEKKRQF
uniref:DUF547 domain-containing protein n=1 Tax=Leptospira ellisii TaxID=2023197 RepID=A0A2N0B5Q8_9LEPT|nr:hypothetical protein CH379_16400 [Leptospira ellisii]